MLASQISFKLRICFCSIFIVAVADLYCQVRCEPERHRYWAEKAEKYYPGHETIHKIRVRNLIEFSNFTIHHRHHVNTACNLNINHSYEGVSKSFRNHPKLKEPETSFSYSIHKTSLKSHYAKLHILLTVHSPKLYNRS